MMIYEVYKLYIILYAIDPSLQNSSFSDLPIQAGKTMSLMAVLE